MKNLPKPKQVFWPVMGLIILLVVLGLAPIVFMGAVILTPPVITFFIPCFFDWFIRCNKKNEWTEEFVRVEEDNAYLIIGLILGLGVMCVFLFALIPFIDTPHEDTFFNELYHGAYNLGITVRNSIF